MNLKTILASLAGALLLALGTWFWFSQTELRSEAHWYRSDAARDNPMLGAAMLLGQNGHKVTVAGTLGELNLATLADGTLIMGDPSSVMSHETAKQLLAWVGRGNTLVAHPRWLDGPEQVAWRIAHPPAAPGGTAPPAADASAAPPAAAAPADDDEDDDEEDDAPAAPAAKAAAKPAVPLAELVARDPIGEHLGLRRSWDTRAPCRHSKTPATTGSKLRACTAEDEAEPPPRRLSLPGAGYWLELEGGVTHLITFSGNKVPLWADEHADTVRVYAEGKGHIAMLVDDYFENAALKKLDHAELLLALAALNPRSHAVTLVKFPDVLPWYRALWLHFSLTLVSLACLLALALWAALRRFGPVLPAPLTERRSLMEHIDASGAWLWKADGGRQLLLDAARAETLALVQRRAPAVARLAPAQMVSALARLADLDEQQLTHALQHEAAPQAASFTQQIRTLQKLRNHYER
jgi:hypothetical protein